ncbi:MAG TPA: hypothetical protein ENK09_08880 [Nitrospirae bacterium]|nr:hypothetical protein [Nitrospirota bacterium]
MDELDKKTQRRLISYADALNRAAPGNIISIIAYGDVTLSRPAGIQTLIVVERIGSEFLLQYSRLKRRFPGFAPPLFFTLDILRSSGDVFPVEILNIKDSYVVVYGEDVLQEIKVRLEDLRTEVEQQVKRQFLKLLDEFLYSLERKADLEQLLTSSLIAFVPLFRNILRLIKKECPVEGTLFKEFCEELGLNDSVFFKIWDIKMGRKRFTKKELLNIFDSYTGEIEKLIARLESLNSARGYCIP